MPLRTRISGRRYSLITSLIALITWQCHAAIVEVDWLSGQFSTGHITINAGDEVDIVNLDDTLELYLTGGPSPAGFFADIPPVDDFYYYVPVIYTTPGTYSFVDEFGASVIVTVNGLQPLSVAITAPTNTATFIAPATFTVTAVPAGGSASYSEIDF
jgi:hypothetical protein